MYKVYQSWEFVTVLGVGHRISKDCTQSVLESERELTRKRALPCYSLHGAGITGMRTGLERWGGGLRGTECLLLMQRTRV